MPNFPHLPLQDESAVTDADLAALLAGKRDVGPRLQPVADVLAALSTEPSAGELMGEARALAEFRRRTGVPVPLRLVRRGTAGVTSRLSTKVATGATAAAVLLGGAATAAFADALPAPIQRFAHDAIGAPYTPAATQHVPAHAKPVAPAGPLASRGMPKASAKPHAAGRHAKRHGQSQQGNGQGQGNVQGQGNGQGQGQGQQDNGQGTPRTQPSGVPHGQGQSDGQGQGRQGNGLGNPHAEGQYGDPHNPGQQGSPHPNPKPAPRHARPARHAPTMDT